MLKPKNELFESFKKKSLYTLAFTHKSWVNEHAGVRESNERLEFLGDAVLEFIVSKELYKKYPQKSEGYLTALRANLVNTESLTEIANRLSVGTKLFLSKGEEDSGGRENPSILANTIEALIGAYYLDAGTDAAEKFIRKNLLDHIDEIVARPLKDAKSRLQELVQSEGFPAPKYQVVQEEGPDHNKTFTIEVIINGKTWGTGTGKNKSDADQKAANDALEKLKRDNLLK